MLGEQTYECMDEEGPAGTEGDTFVVSLAPADFAVDWSPHFAGTRQQIPNDVAIDSQGDVIVVGRFQDSIAFGVGLHASAGSSDVFVAKFPADPADR